MTTPHKKKSSRRRRLAIPIPSFREPSPTPLTSTAVQNDIAFSNLNDPCSSTTSKTSKISHTTTDSRRSSINVQGSLVTATGTDHPRSIPSSSTVRISTVTVPKAQKSKALANLNSEDKDCHPSEPRKDLMLVPEPISESSSASLPFPTAGHAKPMMAHEPKPQISASDCHQDIHPPEDSQKSTIHPQNYYTYRELLLMNEETPPNEEMELEKVHQKPDLGNRPAKISSTPASSFDYEKDKTAAATRDTSNSHQLETDKFGRLPVSKKSQTSQIIQSNSKSLPNMPTSTDHSSSSTTKSQILTSPMVKPEQKFIFYFVPKGTDMHAGVLAGPSETAIRRGATVMKTFRPPTSPNDDCPTHFIVSNNPLLSPDSIASALGFKNPADLLDFVRDHNIVTVKKSWASLKTNKPYSKTPPSVSLDQFYMPLYHFGSSPNGRKKRKVEAKRRIQTTESKQNNDVPQRNLGISQLFEELAKAYREAPMDSTDPWRSYSFQMIAGRVRHLDFDISLDTLDDLRRIEGIGSSTLEIIHEYLEKAEDDREAGSTSSGGATRLIRIQQDPERKAFREMIQIWGVGPAKAKELLNAGYRKVIEVRKAFDEGKLQVDLSRNQVIGLLCHSDLLEHMDREEAEAIARAIKKCVLARYPNAVIHILGSFRRRGSHYSDVDVMITHPKYEARVPNNAIGRIAQDLRRRGHIAYHLTSHPGMDAAEFETLPDSVLPKISSGSPLPTFQDMGKTQKSYMGVFNSPKYKGKRRRVDIKFFPHRERAFALVYFTGNGYFNRSMRLWANRKFGWRLSDKGLFELGTNIMVMKYVDTEKEIFDKLKLVYKEPHERDCFDAVVGIDSTNAATLDGFSGNEFHQEREHKWIE